MIYIRKNKLYYFRRYKKFEGDKSVRHPKLIVDEKNDEYGYMGLTSSKKSGGHYNIPLKINPQKNAKNKSYLRKNIDYDRKINLVKYLINIICQRRIKNILLTMLIGIKKRSRLYAIYFKKSNRHLLQNVLYQNR